MAITKEEKKRLCKSDYMNGVPIDDIISAHKISKSTLYNWIRTGRWSEIRKEKNENFLNAPDKLILKIESIINRMESNSDPGSTSKDADALSKMLSVLKKVYKADNKRLWIIFTAGEMMLFMKNSGITFSEEFIDSFDKFLEKFQEAMLNKYPLNKY